MDAVLFLVYIVHPSGSDLIETSSANVRTCGMYDPFKNKNYINSFRIVCFPLLNNLFSVSKYEKNSTAAFVIYIKIF